MVGGFKSLIYSGLADIIASPQVYDLADEKPEDILHQVLGHLEKLKNDGDKVAIHVRTHLRIIVSLVCASECEYFGNSCVKDSLTFAD